MFVCQKNKNKNINNLLELYSYITRQNLTSHAKY